MLPCLSDRRRVAPAREGLVLEVVGSSESSEMAQAASKDRLELLAGVLESCEQPQLSSNAGDYEVYQNIGEGFLGLANILIAQYKPRKLFTVIRLINLEVLSAEQLEEVQQEMKLSQLLSHHNVTCYLSNFVVGFHLWAVQPLMHYGSCADIMHSAYPFKNGFKEAVIAVILRDVVQGLTYLHNLGYVHRSVRAKHFLIHEDGVVKLSGLRTVTPMIKEGSRHKALHGHFSNTVENICWLAPEVLAQDLSGYSFKSDSYSIGISALELATGEAPFAGLPVTEIMMLKLKGHPPVMLKRPGGEQAPNFSNTFSKVVDLCVQPDPKFRPSPSKILSMSFLKLHKKSVEISPLKMLLRPVVPLDTTQLRPSLDYNDRELLGQMQQLQVQEQWMS